MYLQYTPVTSISSACIIFNALASTLFAHQAKTLNLVNDANNYLIRASLQKDEKRGEIPDEKVLHADRLCQKCMSRNGNVSLTELA